MRILYLAFTCLIMSTSFSFGQNREVISFDFVSQQVQGTYDNAETNDKGLKNNGNQEATFESQFVETELQDIAPFLSVSLKWEASGIVDLHDAELYIRASSDAQNWGDWQEVHTDTHAPIQKGTYFGKLMYFDEHTQFIQTKVILKTGTVVIKKIDIHLYNPGETPPIQTEQKEEDADNALKSNCPCDQPNYLSRNQWCPAGNCPPNSSPTATSPTHLIVHHSDNSNSSSDWAAVVRSIWNYHITVKNFDDIAYNWLIDRNGVIYEGRGDGIKGSHLCGKNSGTQGNCLLGNFTNTQPSNAARNKMVELLAWQACRHNINPTGTSYHGSSDSSLSNISGHRQSCNTECPGSSFYGQLGSLRMQVDNYIDGCSSGGGGSGLDCYNAINLTCGQTYNGSSSNNSSEVGSYGCNDWTETGPERVHKVTPTGSGTLTATLSDFSGDLDVYILGSCDPSDCLGTVYPESATYTNAQANQTYYIVVDSDNGSGSSYQLEVTCPNSGGGQPNLTNQTQNLNISGSTASFSVTIENIGGADAGACQLGYYASPNADFSNLVLIGTDNVVALASGNTTTVNETINLCDLGLSTGTYYVGYYIDNLDEVNESDETDNGYLYWGSSPITFSSCGGGGQPNLTNQTQNLNISGSTASFSVTIENIGGADAAACQLGYYASPNADFSNPVLIGTDDIFALASGNTTTVNELIDLCDLGLSAGRYYVGYYIDNLDEVNESDETDNGYLYWGSSPITFSSCGGGGQPNLTNQTQNLNISGSTASFSVTIENIGGADAGACQLGYYASPNADFSNPVLIGTDDIFALASGYASERSETIDLCDLGLSADTYYVGYYIDNLNQVAESDETDNGYLYWGSSPITVNCAPESYTITTNSNPTNGGITSGSNIYTSGSNASVTATPNSSWTFTNWTESGIVVSNNLSYEFTVTSNRDLVANFTQQNYSITTNSNPTNSGTTSGSNTYTSGSNASVTATPNSSWTFTNWTESGIVVSNNLSYEFTVTSNRDLVANFTQQNYAITTNSNPTNGGITSGSNTYTSGSNASVIATPNSSRAFTNWTESGIVVSNDPSYEFTVTSNRDLVANFTTIDLCPSDNIFFASQEEIDNFPIFYPNCTEIIGDVIINDSLSASITNLQGLNQITSIGGDFNVDFCSALNDLIGLENLTTIGGYLRIVRNPSVSSFQGLNNLSRTGRGFFVRGNPLLNNFDGMENLIDIGGRPMWIFDSNGLNDISGLSNIDYTTISNLQIYDNQNLAMCSQVNICDYLNNNGSNAIYNNASGCNDKVQITLACNVDCPPDNIFFSSQEEIDNFPIFYPNCTEIIGDVIINDSLSASITNLQGLNQITSIGGDFNVDFCSALDDLTGLENLTTIGGYLRIVRNPSVSSFQGLNNLSRTGRGFFVRGNPLLNNFDGMENLIDIGGRPMWIFDSNGLNDISGLSNIDYTTISNLQIYDNQNLAMCSQVNICDYISNGGITQIYNNMNGCNEPIQIIQFCPQNKGVLDVGIKVYPNPAKDVIYISDDNGYHLQQVTIYDTNGRLIQTLDNPSNSIDISGIAQGMYIIKATLERGTFYRKIVIE